jgi:hypothetical protein
VIGKLVHTCLGSSYLIAHVLHCPLSPPAHSVVIGPAVNKHTRELLQRERDERERERSLLTINRWLKVGKYNASFGWHRLWALGIQHMAASTIPPHSIWPDDTPFGNTQEVCVWEGPDRLRSALITTEVKYQSTGVWRAQGLLLVECAGACVLTFTWAPGTCWKCCSDEFALRVPCCSSRDATRLLKKNSVCFSSGVGSVYPGGAGPREGARERERSLLTIK